jgi:hypothetical protein
MIGEGGTKNNSTTGHTPLPWHDKLGQAARAIVRDGIDDREALSKLGELLASARTAAADTAGVAVAKVA